MSHLARSLSYLSVSVLDDVPLVSLQHTEIEYTKDLPEGYADIETVQAGACASELTYYLRRSNIPLSRFERDSQDLAKQEYYLKRNLESGIVDSEANVARFKEVMMHSMFHEGFCRVVQERKKNNIPAIPVQQFIPVRKNGGVAFEKRISTLTLQDGFEAGRLALRNPGYICASHSRGDVINPVTGWPYQCGRDTENHIAKGTIGHCEFLGAAVKGKIRAPLDALTPIPEALHEFVEKDVYRNGRLLTLAEPLSCMFDAFGFMLHSGEKPESILIIGDGVSALNAITFFSVFSPDTKIILAGKYREKLEGIRKASRAIKTVLVNGSAHLGVEEAIRSLSRKGQVDVVLATVPLDKSSVERFVADGGTIVWWAAKMSEYAPELTVSPRYRERFPYGGAPRSEYSAVALLDYCVTYQPHIVEAYLTYPGVVDVELDVSGVKDFNEWLNHDGVLMKQATTPQGKVALRVKPHINLR